MQRSISCSSRHLWLQLPSSARALVLKVARNPGTPQKVGTYAATSVLHGPALCQSRQPHAIACCLLGCMQLGEIEPLALTQAMVAALAGVSGASVPSPLAQGPSGADLGRGASAQIQTLRVCNESDPYLQRFPSSQSQRGSSQLRRPPSSKANFTGGRGMDEDQFSADYGEGASEHEAEDMDSQGSGRARTRRAKARWRQSPGISREG